MVPQMTYTVGQVARVSGVTIRTLHHYDELGLVVPQRSASGHRRYDQENLERLQQVLFFRELDFPLEDIRKIVIAPDFDRRQALLQQRELLVGKLERLRRTVDAIDLAILAIDEGETMEAEDLFGGFDPAEYEEEAGERWGGTDAYQQSARRTRRYTREDWAQLGREGDEINDAFIELMQGSASTVSQEATEVAERHRAHISKWFYECTPEIHAALGQMYVSDQRFTESIDRAAPGLARFMSEAIAANASH